jgi:hypothetical protein
LLTKNEARRVLPDYWDGPVLDFDELLFAQTRVAKPNVAQAQADCASCHCNRPSGHSGAMLFGFLIAGKYLF